MLTSTDKKTLKGIANTLETKYQLGKSGITDTSVDMFDKALTAHELIKIDVMKNVTTEIMELALDLSSKLKAEVVNVIGRTILLYRRNPKNPKIKL
ncbi:MAG: YhbY family RNA-binding protein [Bacilli bacterium]|nr:YhbY family RNA-binding protein [Bacilli bacterium]